MAESTLRKAFNAVGKAGKKILSDATTFKFKDANKHPDVAAARRKRAGDRLLKPKVKKDPRVRGGGGGGGF